MIREETDTDRIEQMLIYLAGRFTFNSEAVSSSGSSSSRRRRMRSIIAATTGS